MVVTGTEQRVYGTLLSPCCYDWNFNEPDDGWDIDIIITDSRMHKLIGMVSSNDNIIYIEKEQEYETSWIKNAVLSYNILSLPNITKCKNYVGAFAGIWVDDGSLLVSTSTCKITKTFIHETDDINKIQFYTIPTSVGPLHGYFEYTIKINNVIVHFSTHGPYSNQTEWIFIDYTLPEPSNSVTIEITRFDEQHSYWTFFICLMGLWINDRCYWTGNRRSEIKIR